MREIMVNQATSCDLKDLVQKFIPESIGKEIEKSTSSIYPLQNVFIRKVKILKAPKFDLGKLMEVSYHQKIYIPWYWCYTQLLFVYIPWYWCYTQLLFVACRFDITYSSGRFMVTTARRILVLRWIGLPRRPLWRPSNLKLLEPKFYSQFSSLV